MRKITQQLKRLYQNLFSRLVITGLVLVLQLVGFPLLLNSLADYAAWIRVACTLLSALMILAVVRTDHTSPEFKIGWMLIFALMPVPGGILYMLWGDKR